MRNALVALICIATCLAQQTRLNYSGQIQGLLKGEDGTAIAGGYVSLVAMPPYPRLRQTTWAAVTGAGGSFQFTQLREGRYRICAQVPRSTWLDPCEWGLGRLLVTLSNTQPVVSTTVVMRKGAAVPIRVDDPGQLLTQHEGRTPGAHLLIGVSNDAFGWVHAYQTSRDAGGREHQVVIPYNSTVNLIVQGSLFQLADAAGQPLPRTVASRIPLRVGTGQQPPLVRLRVTSGGR